MMALKISFVGLSLGLEDISTISTHKNLIPTAFSVVPERATTNRVDDNEEYEEDNVDLSHFFP